MRALKLLRQDMVFNSELSQIIDIFKSIASAEFIRMQANTEKGQAEVLGVLAEIGKAIKWQLYQEQFFIKEDTSLPSAFVAMGTDEGFAGGLNTLVMNALLENRSRKEDEFLVLGERAARYLEEMREGFFYFGGIFGDITYRRAEALVNLLWENFKKKKWGRVFFVYPRFYSVAQQKVEIEAVLPYKPDFLNQLPGAQDSEKLKEVLLEPNAERVFDFFVRINIILKVRDFFYSTKLSEYAARIVHLEGSSHQLTEWQSKLRLDYFKGLHEIRDRNIREIFASRIEE